MRLALWKVVFPSENALPGSQVDYMLRQEMGGLFEVCLSSLKNSSPKAISPINPKP